MSHHDTGETGRPIGHGPTVVHPPTGIMDIHRAADEIVGGRDDDTEEFVISVETYDVMIVRAGTAEDALAKAVTGNPDGSDLDVAYITHDIHACVHTGDEIERDEHGHEGGDEE